MNDMADAINESFVSQSIYFLVKMYILTNNELAWLNCYNDLLKNKMTCLDIL